MSGSRASDCHRRRPRRRQGPLAEQQREVLAPLVSDAQQARVRGADSLIVSSSRTFDQRLQVRAHKGVDAIGQHCRAPSWGNPGTSSIRAPRKEDDRRRQKLQGLCTWPGGTLVVMKTAKKIYESDDQGVVHVDLPVGRSGQRVEVLVVWTDAGELSDADGDELGMADLIGLLKGIDLERPAQGEYEKRDPIA